MTGKSSNNELFERVGAGGSPIQPVLWMGPQDAVRAIWGRNCRKASVIEIVVYNDHESRTLVNEGGTAEIFPFVPLHNAGGMKGFFICERSGKDFL